MTPPLPVHRRRAHDAQIVVTGVTPAEVMRGAFLRAELDAVRSVRFSELAPAAIRRELGDADMLIFAAEATESADAERVTAIASVAREDGLLVAAVLAGGTELSGASPLLATLRDAADMVVLVKTRDAVRGVIEALR